MAATTFSPEYISLFQLDKAKRPELISVPPTEFPTCRYSNVRAYSSNVVHVKDKTYYPASWITDKIIASSAPTRESCFSCREGSGAIDATNSCEILTFDQEIDCPTFMQMLHTHKIPLVINLTDYVERGVVKADPYTPFQLKQTTTFDHYAITCVDVSSPVVYENLQIISRTFELSIEGVAHTFTQMHVTGWADGTAASKEEMFAVIKHVTRFMHEKGWIAIEAGKKPELLVPTIWHCSAGVGRTGQALNSLETVFELHRDPQQLPNTFEIAQATLAQRNQLGISKPEQFEALAPFAAYAQLQLAEKGLI